MLEGITDHLLLARDVVITRLTVVETGWQLAVNPILYRPLFRQPAIEAHAWVILETAEECQ
ncbi:hypothetical protein D3C78_1022670 [compost metagenome]